MANRALSLLAIGLTCSVVACSDSQSSSSSNSIKDPSTGAGGGASVPSSCCTSDPSSSSGGSASGGSSSASSAAGGSHAGGSSSSGGAGLSSGGSSSSSSSSYSSSSSSPGGAKGGASSSSSSSYSSAAGGSTSRGTSTGMSTSAAGGSTYSTGTATGGRGGSTAAATTGPTGTAGAGGAAGSPVGGSPSGGTTATTTTAVPPVAVNPFVMTAHDPFSTFGADVDTASYDVFRQYAQLNKLPPRAGVRTEEYVNYFSYAYPGPGVDGPHPFMISLAAASNVFDRNTTLLRVGIQATKPPAYTKKPTNLVFLLDVSGSMEDPKKLGLIKTMMVDALDNLLDPTDTVSVVTYSTTATVRLPPTSVAKRDTIVTVISGLSAGGSTAGADGIGYAYQQATAGFIEGGINHIVMCTDGDFNVGVSSTADLLTLIKQKRSTGITLTALGFGMGNLNDSMMEAISDAGNGIYSVISDEDHAKTYVRTKMLSTLIHVAKDMKIQVEFSPTQVYAYRLLGYEDRDIADSNFRNDAVDGGEVGAGHRVTALYELVLAGNKIPSFTGMPTPDDGAASTLPAEILPGDAVLVKVRYKDVDATDATQAKEVSTGLAATALTTTLEVADQDLRWAVAVAGLAEILKGSPYASKAFLPLIRNIVASQASRDADRTEFAALLDKIVPLL